MQWSQGDFHCRQASETDLPEIAAIYEFCVRNGDDAFDDQVERAAIAERYGGLMQQQLPFVVAAAPGRVLGFACSEHYHAGTGFAQCVQSSVWIGEPSRRRGVGSALLRALLLACRQARYRQVMSWVMLDNEAGLALHRRLGFVVMGWHREACLIGTRLHDVMLLRHDLWRHGPPPALTHDLALTHDPAVTHDPAAIPLPNAVSDWSCTGNVRSVAL
jgi:L-amino acid N-acyltransferase YncA